MAATTIITQSEADNLAANIDTEIKALGTPPTPPSPAFRANVRRQIQRCLAAVFTPTTNDPASRALVKAALKNKFLAVSVPTPAPGAPALPTGACYYQTGSPAAVACIETNVNVCASRGGTFHAGSTCAGMSDIQAALTLEGIAPF
jgi:hypothetical protein